MPIGICDPCGGYYLLDAETRPPYQCATCSQRLRVVRRLTQDETRGCCQQFQPPRPALLERSRALSGPEEPHVP